MGPDPQPATTTSVSVFTDMRSVTDERRCQLMTTITLSVFGVGRRTIGRGPGAVAAVPARPRRRPEVSPTAR